MTIAEYDKQMKAIKKHIKMLKDWDINLNKQIKEWELKERELLESQIPF